MLLLEARQAAGEWSSGSLRPNPPFVMVTWARSQVSSADGDFDDAPQALHDKGLHLLRAEKEAVRRHRAGVVADPTPAEAEAKEDWRRTGWVTSLSPRSDVSWCLWRQMSRGTKSDAQKCEAFVVSSRPSCRDLERVDRGRKGLAGMYSHLVGIS